MLGFRERVGRSDLSLILRFLIGACIVFHFTLYYGRLSFPAEDGARGRIGESLGISDQVITQNITIEDRTIVVAKTREENTTWLSVFCEDYGCITHIYTMDPEPEEDLLVPRTTQGHEAAAYLTWILDNYDQLPAYTFFIHAGEFQWHNDLFGPRTADTIQNLRFEAVDAHGFVNLRCSTAPGCPDTLIPLVPEPIDYQYAYVRDRFPDLYSELLQVPLDLVPERVGHVCCGQFVVSRETIRRRPREDYERILQWAAETMFTDSYGIGWTIEKLWHIIFGMDAVHCPRYEQCRCDNYGWCGPLPSGEILMPVKAKY